VLPLVRIQGGIVSAMALDFGVSLVFLPSTGTAVSMTSATFAGLVEFDLSAVPPRNEAGGEHGWGVYVCGAALALQQKGYRLHRGLVGHITAPAGLHESGVSSSAAVGVACLLALEDANGLNVTPEENVELDRRADCPIATLTQHRKTSSSCSLLLLSK